MTPLEAAGSTFFRRLHDSPRIEKAHLHGICEIVRFHEGHPPKLTVSLSLLAASRRIMASTQNQALCAILFFLDERVLDPLELAWRLEHLPSVLGRCLVAQKVLVEPVRGARRSSTRTFPPTSSTEAPSAW